MAITPTLPSSSPWLVSPSSTAWSLFQSTSHWFMFCTQNAFLSPPAESQTSQHKSSAALSTLRGLDIQLKLVRKKSMNSLVLKGIRKISGIVNLSFLSLNVCLPDSEARTFMTYFGSRLTCAYMCLELCCSSLIIWGLYSKLGNMFPELHKSKCTKLLNHRSEDY